MTAANNNAEEYAQALLAIARAGNAVERVTEDLAHLLDFIRGNAIVREFLDRDDIAAPGKQHALAGLLGGRIHPLLVQFTLLLAVAGDIGILADIAAACNSAAGDRRTAAGEIHSAVPLSSERIAAVEAEVAIRLGRPVHLRPRVMSNILGGVLVKVGDSIIDGTVDTQLEEARRRLVADM